MNGFLKASGAIAVAYAVFSTSAVAGEVRKFMCLTYGSSFSEPLGDREKHGISANQNVCRFDSGPMAGSVVTGTAFWEWDGTNATLISGQGIERKADATTVYEQVSGKLSLIVADGKVTGLTGTIRGRYRAAFGAAASLAGTSYTITVKSIGPGQLEGEEIPD